MMKRLMVTGAVACSAVALAGCGGASSDDGRPGAVSVGALADTKSAGVALYAAWDGDGVSGSDRFVGSEETAPQLLTATCYGQYPDLRVEVQGPDDAELSAVSGSPTMSMRFAEKGPLDITPPAGDFKWGPTGVDMAINMLASAFIQENKLPKDTGLSEIEVRMLVTCPASSAD